MELIKKHLQRVQVLPSDVLTEFIPLAVAITNEELREHIKRVFLSVAMSKKMREGFNMSDQDMKELFNLAYQKLEDYATLAD